MNNKMKYEEVKIEVVLLDSADIITASAFNGEDDDAYSWFW